MLYFDPQRNLLFCGMSSSNVKIKVGIIDDNKAIIASLAENLNYGKNTRVVFTACEGNILFEQLKYVLLMNSRM